MSLLVKLSRAAGRVVANGADNARGLSKAANPEFGVSGGVNPRFFGGCKLGVQISSPRLRCHAQR